MEQPNTDTSSRDKIFATNMAGSDRDIEAGPRSESDKNISKKLKRNPSSRRKLFETPIDDIIRKISDKTIEVSESDKQQVIQSLEQYTDLGTHDVIQKLTTNATSGLTTISATQRLQTYGPNKLESKPPVSIWARLLDQFTDPLVMLLIAAAIISAVFQHFPEFIAITLIIAANAYIGVKTEGKADDAVAALSASTTNTCDVIRDGQVHTINIENIVPGDIISVNAGTSIAADAVIVWADSDFTTNEASLTGESEPVKKCVKPESCADWNPTLHKNIIFKGSTVSNGKAKAVTIHTGMKTRMGTTAELLNGVEEEPSPLQEKLEDLGKWLGIASVAMSIVVFVVGVTTGRGSDPNINQPVWLQMLLIAVSLTVAAVPEGLPVCVTITLSMGMTAMAKANSIVKTLKSVETLGSATVICSDKTGTLTQGKMTATKLFVDNIEHTISGNADTISGTFEPNPNSEKFFRTMRVAYYCNSAEITTNPDTGISSLTGGNATDKALYNMARKGGYHTEFCKDISVVELKTFNSTRKMMACIVKSTSQLFGNVPNNIVFVKGAPNYIIENSTMFESDKELITKQITAYSDQTYRVIAFSYRVLPDNYTEDDLYQNLTFCGLVALQDPPRPEVPAAIQGFRDAGVLVKMITGDYLNTAAAIAKQINLIDNVQYSLVDNCVMLDDKYMAIDCKKLREVDDATKNKMIIESNVFARATPEDKITIVGVLQAAGHIVAMTGDGVNDAPALKKSDIGVAMGITGTDTAKAAADMILTDDSFASIYSSVREGRRIYANICKFVFFLLTTNPAEVFLVLISVLIGQQAALVPVQILWLNLTTDSFSALALAMEPLEEYVMKVRPRGKGASMINTYMLVCVLYHTIILYAVTHGSYTAALQYFSNDWTGGDNQDAIKEAQTVTIYVIVFSELLRSFTCRSLKYSSFSLDFWSNKYVPLAFFSAIGLTVAIGHIPVIIDVFEMSILNGKTWGCLIAVSVIPSIADELFKAFSRCINLEEKSNAFGKAYFSRSK